MRFDRNSSVIYGFFYRMKKRKERNERKRSEENSSHLFGSPGQFNSHNNEDNSCNLEEVYLFETQP